MMREFPTLITLSREGWAASGKAYSWGANHLNVDKTFIMALLRDNRVYEVAPLFFVVVDAVLGWVGYAKSGVV
jgi:hypothetical protein